MADTNKNKIASARETLETLLEISRLLNTGLDAETLAICVRLCESGVNPEALAMVIREMRRETATMTVSAADRDLTIPETEQTS